jgi:GNAT superfamily N-acetyltransferase
MAYIPTKTTYLEMFAPPATDAVSPRADIDIEQVACPSTAYYRELYRSVGEKHAWVDRLVMPDEELESILSDDRVSVFVLRVAGRPAGYSELDRRVGTEIELAYFGLFPAYLSQGLGSFFLRWTLHTAWSLRPTRVWVHTCDLDHPAALPTYLKAGFQVYDEKVIAQFVPDQRC